MAAALYSAFQTWGSNLLGRSHQLLNLDSLCRADGGHRRQQRSNGLS